MTNNLINKEPYKFKNVYIITTYKCNLKYGTLTGCWDKDMKIIKKGGGRRRYD